MEDNEIVDLYWARSEDAIGETEAKYGRYCYYIAFNILHDNENSEECVNDTYLKAWNAMPDWRPNRLSAFLGKIARNLALNRWESYHAEKRGSGQVPLALEELHECIPSAHSGEGLVDELALADVLDHFLASLPKEKRTIFIRRYREMPYKTACGITVTLALSKSRALILADLDDSFVTVHIPYGSGNGIERAHLERVADSIDFAALDPVAGPEPGGTVQSVERDPEARKVYAAVLRNLLYSGTLPDGRQAELPTGESSQFAVANVDADGKEELVLLWDAGVMANSAGYIVGYDTEAKSIYIQLEEFPAFAFLKSGDLKAQSSHDHTWGELWPYKLYRYSGERDRYETAGYVYAEDKAVFAANGVPERYPAEADVSGTGTVYYIGADTWGTVPMDEAAYSAWLKEEHGDAAELEVRYLPLTEESILTIVQR